LKKITEDDFSDIINGFLSYAELRDCYCVQLHELIKDGGLKDINICNECEHHHSIACGWLHGECNFKYYPKDKSIRRNSPEHVRMQHRNDMDKAKNAREFAFLKTALHSRKEFYIIGGLSFVLGLIICVLIFMLTK